MVSEPMIAQIVVDSSVCGAKAATNFILGFVFALSFFWLATAFDRWLNRKNKNFRRLEDWSALSRFWKVLYMILFVGVGLIGALQQTESAIRVFASKIEVQGCQGGWPFEVVYDRSEMSSRYAFRRNRGGVYDHLELSAPGKRSTEFSLGDARLDGIIRFFAPDVLDDYAKQLKSEGKHIPAHLANRR